MSLALFGSRNFTAPGRLPMALDVESVEALESMDGWLLVHGAPEAVYTLSKHRKEKKIYKRCLLRVCPQADSPSTKFRVYFFD